MTCDYRENFFRERKLEKNKGQGDVTAREWDHAHPAHISVRRKRPLTARYCITQTQLYETAQRCTTSWNENFEIYGEVFL